MKRQKKKIEKRTYTLKNAFPRFVSIVPRGANLIPLNRLQFSEENAKFADVEIHQIEFAHSSFADQAQVEDYLRTNNYEDFSIREIDTGWVVDGLDSDKFEDIQTVEYDDGVFYKLGKLKKPVEDQPTTDIVDTEIVGEFADNTEETQETVEAEADGDTEVVTESETEAATEEATEETVVVESEETNEEAESEGAEASSEQVTESESTGSEAEGEQEEKEEVTTEVVTESEPEEVTNEDTSSEEAPVRAEKYSEFLKAASEKFSDDYSNFRHQIEQLKQRGVIMSYDMVTYVFNDCCFSALYSNDLDQFKKNCNDYYKVVTALVSAAANLEFSEEEVVVEDETSETTEDKNLLFSSKEELAAFIKEKIQESKQNSEKDVDENVIVIQNSQRIKSDDIIDNDNKAEDTKVEKFKERETKDLFGIR